MKKMKLFLIIMISLLFSISGLCEGWLGIEYTEVDDKLYKQMKLRGWKRIDKKKYVYKFGILVTCVYKDSPADKAGIRPGHVITGIAFAKESFTFNAPHQEGLSFKNSNYFMDKYIRKRVGKNVPIMYGWLEDGKKKGKTVKVKIVHRPSSYIDYRAYDLEIQGDELKKQGKLTEAYNKYLHASNHWQSGDNFYRIRIKCIKTYRLIESNPTISEDAKMDLYIANELVKNSKSQAELIKAHNKFKEASTKAPWWSDPYFNLGLICEKLNWTEWAIAYYKLYLEADPNAKDKEAVKKKIAYLEYKLKN